MPAAKRILVLLRREPAHPKTAQGLRTAVAYAAHGLEVTVALCGAATALEQAGSADASTSPVVLRHLATLRAFQKVILPVTPESLCELVTRADAMTTW